MTIKNVVKQSKWTDCKKCGTSKHTNQYRVKGKDGSVLKCIDPYFCNDCIVKLRRKHIKLEYRMMNQYINIIQTRENPKTNIYTVYNKQYETTLGIIKWYSAWRQYCFYPWTNSIFNKDCMRFIADFMDILMKERK